MRIVREKTKQVFDMYRPGGLAQPTPTCWRGLFMAERLKDLLIYEGYAVELCKVFIGCQGHVCVRVEKDDCVYTADPSIAAFVGDTSYLCQKGEPSEAYCGL